MRITFPLQTPAALCRVFMSENVSVARETPSQQHRLEKCREKAFVDWADREVIKELREVKSGANESEEENVVTVLRRREKNFKKSDFCTPGEEFRQKMFRQQSSSPAKVFIVIITFFQVTKCSHVEISKADNLEFNRQKVKNNFNEKMLYLEQVAGFCECCRVCWQFFGSFFFRECCVRKMKS